MRPDQRSPLLPLKQWYRPLYTRLAMGQMFSVLVVMCAVLCVIAVYGSPIVFGADGVAGVVCCCVVRCGPTGEWAHRKGNGKRVGAKERSDRGASRTRAVCRIKIRI